MNPAANAALDFGGPYADTSLHAPLHGVPPPQGIASTGPVGSPGSSLSAAHLQYGAATRQDLLADDGHDLSSAKAFTCSHCNKGFARRSDLVRHERIHNGDRPHICSFQGCGKQFIQRSALTVHERVHTHEKPHQCEKCGKPFSDSSSLARHRRIHSGLRPYKCLYANCQKTFTRRTTLTRHMNHHTGTVEEAAAARAQALATRATETGEKNDGFSEHFFADATHLGDSIHDAAKAAAQMPHAVQVKGPPKPHGQDSLHAQLLENMDPSLHALSHGHHHTDPHALKRDLAGGVPDLPSNAPPPQIPGHGPPALPHEYQHLTAHAYPGLVQNVFYHTDNSALGAAGSPFDGHDMKNAVAWASSIS